MDTSGEQRVDTTVAMETVEQCNGGTDAILIEKRLNLAFQKIYKLIIAMCVLFVLLLIVCAFCAFLYTENLQNRQEIRHRCGCHDNDGPSNPKIEYLTESEGRYEEKTNGRNDTEASLKTPAHDREKRKDKDDASEKDRKNNKEKTTVKDKPRRDRGNRVTKCCKRLGKKLAALQKSVKKMRREVQELTPATPTISTRTTTQKTQTIGISTPPPTKQNFISHVAAAHYRSYITNDYIQSVFKNEGDGHLYNAVLCMDKPDWHGKLCRNRTLVTTVAPVTLNVFREADWMSNVSNPKVFDMRNGTFIARQTGIYLVYAHVLFYDARTEQAIELVHVSGRKEENTFRSRQNQGNINPKPDIFPVTKYMTCSINTVLYMKQGDQISIRNLYPNSSIDITADATYFGALVFMNMDD